MKIVIEVINPRGLSRAELAEAVETGAEACLEMPGWGSAPQVKVLSYEGGEDE